MRVYELQDPDQLRLRAHPWVDAEADASHRYYDFRAHPERIRTSLEDLLPWGEHGFTETFYRLLEWLNGPQSSLETNDCAFHGISPNEGPHSTRRLEASGRLMVLSRNLAANTRPDHVGGLAQRVAIALSQMSEGIEAVVGVTIVDVQFTTLPGSAAQQRGQQLMLSFWAWGDDEAETLGNVDHTLGNLAAALRAAG